MKKIFSVIFTAALLLKSCDKTPVQTESVGETTTEASLTVTTSAISAEVTAESESAEMKITDLKAVIGKNKPEPAECEITEDLMASGSPASEKHIELAKNQCLIDAASELTQNNGEYVYAQSPEDIALLYSAGFDFDGDGENESVAVLDYIPDPSVYHCDSDIYYVDGENVYLLSHSVNGFGQVFAYNFGGQRFMQVNSSVAAEVSNNIYAIDGGAPVFDIVKDGGGTLISFENGIFYVEYCFDYISFPVMLFEDGVLRRLATEPITEKDFCAHFENGREFLDYCELSGKPVRSIETIGYQQYWLDDGTDKHYFGIDTESGSG